MGMVGGMAVVSRAASAVLHGDAFVRVRESAWAAKNPFSIVTDYKDGVVTSEAVKTRGIATAVWGGRWDCRWGEAVARRRGGGDRGFSARWKGGSRFRCSRRWRRCCMTITLCRRRRWRIFMTCRMTSWRCWRIAVWMERRDGTERNAALDYLESLTGTTERKAYRVMGTVRLDASPTARDHVTVSYAGNRFDSPSGAALGQASDAVVSRGMGSLGDSVVHVDVGSGRWLHQFSKRLNNEVRGQVAHDLDYETPHAPLAQEPAIGPYGYAPQVSIAPNGFSFGTPSSLAPGASGGRSAYPDETRLELADTMQWHVGRHLLMAGADWSRIHDRINTLSAEEGAFSYDSGTTNGKDGGLVDWITDYTFSVHAYPNGACPSIVAAVHYFCFRSFTQSFGATDTEFVTHNVAGFMEDAMRVRSNLSVTLGLRYDYTLLPKPQTANPLLDADIAMVGGAIHGATATFPEDRNNFGPRLAVVWAPSEVLGLPKRWQPKRGQLFIVRLGYGVFYSHIPGRNGTRGAGGYGTAFDDDACADTADDHHGLSADHGGKPGVWLSVRLHHDAPGGGGADDFGDSVCERLSGAHGAAWRACGGADVGASHERATELCDGDGDAAAG